MSFILVIFLLILFSIVFFLVWFWFFKGDNLFVENFYKLGDKALKKGNFAKAKEALLKAKEENQNPDVIRKLGVIHLKLKEYAEAKACFEQIIKVSPNDVDALSNLAQVLQLLGQEDEALEIYTKLAAQDNQNAANHVRIADIYLKKGDSDKALEILNAAKEFLPENTEILFAITKCKGENCDIEDEANYKELISEYKKLSGEKELPKDYDISLANLYAKNGEIDKAFLHCKKALEVDSEDAKASKLMGLIQLIKKDFAGAKNSLTTALNLQPGNKEAHEIFSYLICNQDERCARKKCRETYQNLVQKHIK